MAALAFHFSFWQQKEKQKQKERLPAALFWLFPRLFPLNKKNSLTLKQLFVFNATTTSSISRQKR